jgi:hypothetical protein
MRGTARNDQFFTVFKRFYDDRFVLYADKENGGAKPFLTDAPAGRLWHGWSE